MKATKQVIILEDGRAARDVLKDAFENASDYHFVVHTATNADQADEIIKGIDCDVLVIDLHLGVSPEDGLQWMSKQLIFSTCPNAVKFVVTAHDTRENLVRSIRLGAWDVIDKSGAFGSRTVCSACQRLRELEELKNMEHYIFNEWLPANQQWLQVKHSSEYIAVDEKGNVIAHAKSLIALGSNLSPEHFGIGKQPFILRIGGPC